MCRNAASKAKKEVKVDNELDDADMAAGNYRSVDDDYDFSALPRIHAQRSGRHCDASGLAFCRVLLRPAGIANLTHLSLLFVLAV